MDGTELPITTSPGNRSRLPQRPEVVVAFFEALVSSNQDNTLEQVVAQVCRNTHAARPSVESLAGWLPLSRVASWAEDGELRLHPETDLVDLAVRFAAWVGSRPVPEDQEQRTLDMVRRVVELALERARVIEQPRGVRHNDVGLGAPVVRTSPEMEAPEGLGDRLANLLAQLDGGFLERNHHVRSAMLALLAGRHVLLLGPPGTAKSLLARALCGCFRDASYFEYLLSRFTHPDELFGPVSIPGLKDEDYRRLTNGFLPQAHVAFLDEIFKANSAILNSLLTLINERVFHHGRHRDEVPLIGLIGASNELPDPDGGLAALYDRFLVRMPVPPLGESSAFLAVATGEVGTPEIEPEMQLTLDDLAALRDAAADVVIPDRVRDALVVLWRMADVQEWSVSDRRWRQAVDMLRVAAAAEGRGEVDLPDLLLLEPVLAPTPDRIPAVRQGLLDYLARRVVPEHDLRAQWSLLGQDRVAPFIGGAADLASGGSATDRLVRRKLHLERFLVHHREAVARLASDRQRLEHSGTGRLWRDAIPAQLIAGHISASRELARFLEAAEAYAGHLETAVSAATALIEALPRSGRRRYEFGAVCRLQIPDADIEEALSLGGERVGVSKEERWKDPVASNAMDDTPTMTLTSMDWLALVDGTFPPEQLLARIPASARRNAAAALGSVRRHLDSNPVPRPPEVPA